MFSARTLLLRGPGRVGLGAETGCEGLGARQFFTAVVKRLAPAADHPPLQQRGTLIQPPRRPHLPPPALAPPPQARAEQEDEDEKRLGWFVRQLQPEVFSRRVTLSDPVFA